MLSPTKTAIIRQQLQVSGKVGFLELTKKTPRLGFKIQKYSVDFYVSKEFINIYCFLVLFSMHYYLIEACILILSIFFSLHVLSAIQPPPELW